MNTKSAAVPAALEHKVFELADVKMKTDGNGGFSGHASAFGNVDRVEETVVAGAFKNTLASFIRDGFLALNHDWKDAPIGYIVSAKEDAKGLMVEVAFHSGDVAQGVRRVMQERLAAKKSVSLSIGYRVKQDEMRADGVRLLTELELFEVSFVNVPANPMATVDSVKGRTRAAGSSPGIFEQKLQQSTNEQRGWQAYCQFLQTEARLSGVDVAEHERKQVPQGQDWQEYCRFLEGIARTNGADVPAQQRKAARLKNDTIAALARADHVLGRGAGAGGRR